MNRVNHQYGPAELIRDRSTKDTSWKQWVMATVMLMVFRCPRSVWFVVALSGCTYLIRATLPENPSIPMETTPLPRHIVREGVFQLFRERLPFLRPLAQRGRRSQDPSYVPLEGSIERGYGHWLAEYDFRTDRWTRLFERGVGGNVPRHDRIYLRLTVDGYIID